MAKKNFIFTEIEMLFLIWTKFSSLAVPRFPVQPMTKVGLIVSNHCLTVIQCN